nr:MAG TPA_asm: hypothetical protein [Caudoviricetes sp.]
MALRREPPLAVRFFALQTGSFTDGLSSKRWFHVSTLIVTETTP